jgi:hypothetical protein
MDVMSDRANRIGIQQNRLITPLENMPVGFTKMIETVCESALQSLHSLYKIRLRRLYQQMIMIAH